MSYNFTLTADPDLELSTPEKGVVKVKFEKPMSFFNMTDTWRDVENLLLRALGYAPEDREQPKKGSQGNE